MKTFKKYLAVMIVTLHIFTFSGPVHATDIYVPRDTILEGNIDNPAGSTLNYYTDGSAGLRGDSFFNAGDINFFGNFLLAFQNFVNTGNIAATGNLLITTLGADAAQFFAGMASLHQNAEGPGRFFNSGSIAVNGDWLAIAAGTFSNVGTLSAGGGVVGISAGSKQVTFPLTQDGVISMEVNDPIAAEVFDKDGKKVSDVWKNDGTIKGSVVIVKARGAEKAFDNIINHTGIIEAQTIGEKNGKIVLDGGDEGVVRVNGTLDASGRDAGEKGGTVHVLGDKVGLFENAKIDVSGHSGGGEVLVGGDYQGKGIVKNANFTYMHEGAKIWADALVSGNGGKVILWANNTTRAYGSISAQGGALSGNGGFVETSGKEYLDVAGIRVDAGASNGLNGNWLLDPLDVNIVSGGTGVLAAGVFTPVVGTTTIDPLTIMAALNAGTSVEINTGTTGSDAGNITVTDAISKTAGAAVTLTLKAAGAISIGASISVTGSRIINLVLQSGGSITQTAGTLAARGTTSITAGAGNDVSLNASGNNFTGAVTIASANNVTLVDTNAIGLGASTISGNLNLTAGGAITDSGALSVAGNTTLTAGGNNITLDTAANDFVGAVSVISGNNVTLRDANAIDLGASTIGGNLSVRSNGAITDSGNLTVSGTATLRAETGNDITLNESNDFNSVTITSGRNVTLNDSNAISLGTASVSGDMSVTSAGTLTVTGALTSANRTTNGTTGGFTLTSTGADVVLNANVTTGNATVTDANGTNNLAASGDINISAATSVTGSGRLITGNAAISGASRTGTDNATSGDISINAGTGGVSGGIGLSSANALTVGTASRTGGGAGTDTATAGTIALNTIDEINNGTLSTALDVNLGAASGALTNNAGSIAATTTGTSGNIFLTSTGTLNVGALGTDGLSAQNVNVSASGGAALNIGNAAESLAGDTIVLDSGAGTLTVADTAFDAGSGSLTLRGNEIDLTGGADSVRGTGILLIESNTAAQDITIGGAADSGAALDILASDVTALRDGFSSITIGRNADGTGVITQQAATFNDDLKLVGGSLVMSGALTSSGNTVTLAARTGDINGAGLITAATIDADAVTGIGNTTALNTAASTITADTTNGNIDIDNTLGTAVNAVSLTTGTGTIDFDQTGGGALTITNASTGNGDIAISVTGADLTATSTTAGAAGAGDGNIDLTTLTSGNILLGNVTGLDDTVTVTSAGTINDTDAPDDSLANVSAGTINLNATGGDIGTSANLLDINPSTVWNASVTSGDSIYVRCTGDCPMGAIDVGTGHFGFEAAGAITDGNDAVNGEAAGGLVNITAGSTTLQAGTGIGAIGNWIELRLSDAGGVAGDGKMEMDSGTGGTFVSNKAMTGFGLTVGGIGDLPNGIQATGGISVYSGSPLTVVSDIVDLGAGTINLTTAASAGNDDITLSAKVSTVGGKLELFSGDAINQTASRIVATDLEFDAGGSVKLDRANNNVNTVAGTSNGTLTLNDTNALTVGAVGTHTGLISNNNLIDVSADGLLTLAQLVDAGSGNVKLTSTGNAIADGNGAALNVVGNKLTAAADNGIGSGDALETTVDSLDATNTTSGNIDINETDALDIVKIAQNAPNGTVNVDAGGTITVTNGGSGITSNNGKVELDANGAASSIAVRNTITTTGGNINLLADHNVTFNAAGDMTSTTGNIKVQADADAVADGSSGAITMNDGTLINAGSGKIDMDADENITLGGLLTTNSTNTAVTLTSTSGRIVDGGDTYTDVDASSGRLVIDAVTGVGSGDAIETTVDSLDIDNTGSGNININETDALDIVKIAQGSAAGIVNVDAGGTITVTAGGSGITSNSGKVELDANGVASSIAVKNIITTTGGDIRLFADDDVTFTAAGDLTSAGGDVKVNADAAGLGSGVITMANGTLIDAGSGKIDMDAFGDITLGGLLTTNATNTAVTLTSTAGAIVDGGNAYTDVDAVNGRLVINAVTGVGSGNAIETAVSSLNLTNTTSGDVRVDEIAAGGNLDVIKAWQTGAGTGDMVIRVLGGDLTVVAGQSGVAAQGGETTLYSATSDVLVNDTVTSTSGKINIDASSDVIFSAAGDVTSTSGEVEIETNTGQVFMADGTLIDAGSGQIDIDAQTDITLGGLKTTNATDTAVVLVSRAGAIVDGGDTHTDIETGAGGGMLLKANSGIGSADGLDTQGSKLAARTETGNIQLFNTGALEIKDITDDNDPTTFFGNAGAGALSGVLNNDSTHVDPNSIIFITSASPMTITSAVTNLDGGDITLYALGAVPGVDTMTINNDIRTEGGNGDIRIVSGSDMIFDSLATGKTITVSTAGNGVLSGTGQVILGAGYDATGKAANESASTLVGPGGTAGDTGANLTMTPASSVTTEDGNILVDAQNDFTVGLLHADGGTADLSDGIRGDVTTFSRNGSTLDADTAAALPQLTNIHAGVWNGTAGGSIGLSDNPIETNAPIQNLNGAGGVYVTDAGSVLLNADSANGSIVFQAAGDILLGHAFAGNGQVNLTAGSSILSQGGGSTRIIANDVIKLVAGGIIGTAGNAIQTQLNHAGNLFLEAHGQEGILSINVLGNFTRASVQFLNTPPGLALFNGLIVGGQAAGGFESGTAMLYYNPNPVNLPAYGQFNGRYAADFPATFNMERFAFAPATSINTSGIDVMPIEGLGILRPVVPIPTPAIPPVPAPETEQPPLTVPLPGLAQAPVPQPTQDQATSPVYVSPGRGTGAAAPSVSGTQAGLAGAEEQKKKAQRSPALAGTPPLVVPIPASAQGSVREHGTENQGLPFYVGPLSQTVSIVRDRIRQMQSPIEQNEAVSGSSGSVQPPASLGSEALTQQ